MIELSGSEIAAHLQGALRVIDTPRGVQPVRLAEAAEIAVPTEMVRQVFYNTTCVRLRFHSHATEIEIDCALATVGSELGKLPFTPTFELVSNGEVVARSEATMWQEQTYRHPMFDHRFVGATDRVTDTIRFVNLPAGPKDIEIWLPPYASTEVFAIRSDRTLQPWIDRRPRWVHYGSSISHAAMDPNPTAAWPAVAARIADVNLINLGAAGECHLDQFVARAIRDIDVDFISVKAGINILVVDSLKDRTFASTVHGFLDTIRDGHPATPIVLASPTYCGFIENYPGPFILDHPGERPTVDQSKEPNYGALTLRRMRSVLAEVVAARSDPNLRYLDGLALIDEQDAGLLVDALHPGKEGARLIGERFAQAAFGDGERDGSRGGSHAGANTPAPA